MDSEQLRELIKREESAKLDFKIKLYDIYNSDNKDDYRNMQWDEFIKDILSLANGNIGTQQETGYLIIGAGNTLKPDGTRDINNVEPVRLNRKQILDKVNSACQPPLPNILFEQVELDSKNLLVISIPPTPYLHVLKRHLKTPKKEYSIYTVLIRRKDGEEILEACDQQKEEIRKEKQNYNKCPTPAKMPLAQSILPSATNQNKILMSPFERLQFIKSLNEISSEDLDSLIFALNVPSHILPSRYDSQGKLVNQLAKWAETRNGCGLAAVKQMLEEIQNPQ